MSYTHISSKEEKNKKGKTMHTRVFSNSYGLYQEDKYREKNVQ